MKKFFLVVTGFLLCNLALASDVFNRDIIANGDFEDNLNSWTCNSNCNVDENISYNDVYYTHYLDLGSILEYEETIQTVDISSNTGKAEFIFSCEYETSAMIDNDYFIFMVKDHNTGVNYIRDYVYPSDNTTNCGNTYNFSSYAGKTIDIIFGVFNDNEDLTTVAIDDVFLTEKSYAFYKGQVFDKQNNKEKNLNVVIKRYNGKKLWQGTTNSNGIFKATRLKGYSYDKAYVIFKKNGITEKYRRYIDWGKSYNKKFHLETIE